jgi:hypothetical protein
LEPPDLKIILLNAKKDNSSARSLDEKKASVKSLYRKFSDLISLREKVAQAELAANASDKGNERTMAHLAPDRSNKNHPDAD